MNKKIRASVFPVTAGLALLTACGGGEDADSNPITPIPTGPTAEGAYTGTISGASDSDGFVSLILENGDVWALYGHVSPPGEGFQNLFRGTFFSSGFLHGSGASSNGSYTTTNLWDFADYPATRASLTSTYDSAGKTIAGSASYSEGTVQFSGGPIPGPFGVDFNYDSTPSRSAIAGEWLLFDAQGLGIAVTVEANGDFEMEDDDGCTATGRIVPRPSGKNVFNVSLRFGNTGDCDLPGGQATGVAISYRTPGGFQQLIAAVTDTNRTAGVVATGFRE